MRWLISETIRMRYLDASLLFRLALAGMSAAVLASCAQPPNYPVDSPCRAVERIADGSWRTKRPVVFGRSIRVEAGTIIYRRTVIDGVDLGAALDRECGGDEIARPAHL